MEFAQKIEHIKNVTGMHELFEVGYYQDGKIELGYLSELNELSPENGEVLEFECRRQSYLDLLIGGYKYITELISSSI